MFTYGCRQLSLVLLTILLGTLLSFGQNVQVHRLAGKVLDQNRAPVAGATVAVISKGNDVDISTLTNAAGEFSFAIEAGEITIKVLAAGFAESRRAATIKSGGSEPIEIVLEIAAASASVNVVDAANYHTRAVNSATKTVTAVRDIAQSITTVNKEQIKDQMMTSMGDVLRYMPGVTVHQGENNRDQVIIRGQSSSADFYLNGVRDDVQYYRDVYNLERVETLKGPNAMIFGRGGGGGVVNRVSKEAIFSPLREISFQGGSYYNGRFSGDLDKPINDQFAFRLNGVYENSDSFRKFVNLNRAAFNPTFTYKPGANTAITFGYEFLRDRRTADRGITSFQGKPANVSRDTFYGNPDDSHVRSNVNILSGTIDHQLGELTIHNRTSYGDYDRFYQNYVPREANASGTLVTITAYNNSTKRRNFFNQTDLSYRLSTGTVKHTILGGVELGNQRTNNFRNTGYFNNLTTSTQAAFSDPTIDIPVTFRQTATDANNRLNTDLAATYVQDQIEISRYFRVILGIRYDYFDLKYHNHRSDTNLRRIDNLVSPRVGFVVKPIEPISIYGSYSVSHLPSSGDQFSSLTSITEQAKPEKFQNYEVGVKWDIRENLFFTSAVYRLDRTNTRATDPNDPGAIIQTGSQRTNGFEIGLNGNILPKWNIAGGYALQDAYITSATTSAAAGLKVGQTPHNTFSLWNKYQINPRLGVGLGIINRSEMFATVDNTVRLPSYTRADAAVYYTISERWRIQANFENLLDKNYILNADSNTNLSPGSPRAVRVGLIARF